MLKVNFLKASIMHLHFRWPHQQYQEIHPSRQEPNIHTIHGISLIVLVILKYTLVYYTAKISKLSFYTMTLVSYIYSTYFSFPKVNTYHISNERILMQILRYYIQRSKDQDTNYYTIVQHLY